MSVVTRESDPFAFDRHTHERRFEQIRQLQRVRVGLAIIAGLDLDAHEDDVPHPEPQERLLSDCWIGGGISAGGGGSSSSGGI